MRAPTFADTLRYGLLAALGLPCWVACGGDAVESSDSPGPGTGGTGVPGSGGTGSVPSTGGTGGVISTGGAQGVGGTPQLGVCTNPQPLLPGYDTGFVTCDEGHKHRAEQRDCPVLLPRVEPARSLGSFDQCAADDECPGEHDYCGVGIGGPAEPSNVCITGCVNDAECGSGSVCVCGDPVGICQPAECATASDCEGGELCVGATREYCGTLGMTFVCESPTDQCNSDADCPLPDLCQAQEGGRRCVSMPCGVGRPFLVDFLERRAEAASRSDWTQPARGPELAAVSPADRALVAAHWTDVGLMEHASIAAFARFSLQLLALGAPADLIEETNRALADETRHARLCFALASSYGGAPVGPGRLDIAGALGGATPESILRTVIAEGCIGETQAALEAAEARALCTDAAVSDVLDAIARDEARHAELAWRFVSWLLTEHPELRDVAESEFRIVFAELAEPREASATPGLLARYGVLDAASRRRVRRTALESVIGPCVTSLLMQGAEPMQSTDSVQGLERPSATLRSVARASDSAVRS